MAYFDTSIERHLGLLFLIPGLCVLLMGCSINSERNQANDLSAADLYRLGHFAAEVYSKQPVDFGKCQSVDEFLKVLQGTDLVPPFRWSDFNQDTWGRSFRWSVTRSNENETVRMLSDGRDGISQAGEGDDLYLELRIVKRTRLEVRVRTVSVDGIGKVELVCSSPDY
jgi:hypothetical protein